MGPGSETRSHREGGGGGRNKKDGDGCSNGGGFLSDSDGGKLRLFVGGLPKDIRPEELRERFSSFGVITDAVVIPEKRTYPIPLSSLVFSASPSTQTASLIRPCASTAAGIHGRQEPSAAIAAGSSSPAADGQAASRVETALCRGFGYVELKPKSEASLRQCFSLFNGCKWRGGQLKVEKAKEHYTDRLLREWEAAAKLAAEEEAKSEGSLLAAAKQETVEDGGSAGVTGESNKLRPFPFSDPSFSHKLVELKPLKIAWHHCSKKLKVVPAAGGPGTGKHRRSFPRVEALPLEQILEEAAMGGKRRKVEELAELDNAGAAHQNDVDSRAGNRRRGNAAKVTPSGRGAMEDPDMTTPVRKGPIVGFKRVRLDQDTEDCDHPRPAGQQGIDRTGRIAGTAEPAMALGREESKKPARRMSTGFVPVARFDPSAEAGQQLGVFDSSLKNPSVVREKQSSSCLGAAEEKVGRQNVDDSRGKRGRSVGEQVNKPLEAEGKRARKLEERAERRVKVWRGSEDEEDEREDDEGGSDELDYDDKIDDSEADMQELEGLSSWERALAMAAGTKEILGSAATVVREKQVRDDPEGHEMDVLGKEFENELASPKNGKGSQSQKQSQSGGLEHFGSNSDEKKVSKRKTMEEKGGKNYNRLNDRGDEGGGQDNNAEAKEAKGSLKASGSKHKESAVSDHWTDVKRKVEEIEETEECEQLHGCVKKGGVVDEKDHEQCKKKSKKGKADRGGKVVSAGEEGCQTEGLEVAAKDGEGESVLRHAETGACQEVGSGAEVDLLDDEGRRDKKGREKKKDKKAKFHRVIDGIGSAEECGHSDVNEATLLGSEKVEVNKLDNVQEESKKFVGLEEGTGGGMSGNDKNKHASGTEMKKESGKIVTPISAVVTSAWKSLVDAEGRASFSLSAVLGGQKLVAGRSKSSTSPISLGTVGCSSAGLMEKSVGDDLVKMGMKETSQGADHAKGSRGKDTKKRGKGKGQDKAEGVVTEVEDRDPYASPRNVSAGKEAKYEGEERAETAPGMEVADKCQPGEEMGPKRTNDQRAKGKERKCEGNGKVGEGSSTGKGAVTNVVTVKSSWNALVDADGRASFSLGAILADQGPAVRKEEFAQERQQWKPRQGSGSMYVKDGVGVGVGSTSAQRCGGEPGHNRDAGGEKQMDEKVKNGEEDDESKAISDKKIGLPNSTVCSFMRAPNAEEEWLASKTKLQEDFMKKRKAAVKFSKAMTGKWSSERGFRSLR
ncbi:hypothetical protein CBR_g39420 [Chara braunii]|uniref:RRM domain-containing protein n=1 Tax=Chara braunii TaxID=69332 RepID=A0A388LRM3_CHABU|nr:hypothetical protein CBR_g39420 [Chara braunii]|eukprot:GBG84957.1 hypothetical protein CBR_g39420 [Chara braunii]